MMGDNKISILKEIPLFAGLGEDLLLKIEAISIEKSYKKGEIIILQDTSVEGLYILVSGRLRISRSSEDGRVKVLAILSPGDIIGEMSLLDDESASATVETMEDSRLILIRKEDFQAMLLRYPLVTIEIARILGRRLRSADKEIEELAFYSVKNRLIEALIDLANRHSERTSSGIRVSLRITHQDLADMVGSSRETITRIMNLLERDQLIVNEGGYIVIKDINRLKTYLL
ncbi:MAG TPA: Crp/Fnr family transcriptional regulator [bacterium]|jgi:CRP/FNR family transcriptional regulator|nr:Crp/Fnr family transcriptional regulator [bacterium]HOK29920.1 Crp/Fnr family transcriptional regulator [bacterium]HOL55223.1 Crp/Fnr family transcriptional regulator [bacterium]HON71719.1 Crp/Fnr family transcriptional regulator [bacterium]HPO82312.1 Crp/Fnr family transcriptional regulator [bacterium]